MAFVNYLWQLYTVFVLFNVRKTLIFDSFLNKGIKSPKRNQKNVNIVFCASNGSYLRKKEKKSILTSHAHGTYNAAYTKNPCPEVVSFFLLNSAEHEMCPVNASQITNNCKFFLAIHS